MALFQLMRSNNGLPDEKVGKNGTNLKHLKRRLTKLHRGYVVEMCPAPKGNTIRAIRGYSKAAQEALATCGMEVVA